MDNTPRTRKYQKKGSRLRSLWSRLAWLATVLALAVSATAAPLHRIVAVGDLHGDFSAWRDILRSANLADNNGHWTGGDTILIQTGDAVDRGPHSLEIIQDLIRLQKESARAHGQVIALVGNHEAMNLIGDLRYVSAADYAGYADRQSASRRENVYNSNKAAIEMAYRQKDPQMSSEAIKKVWFEAFPLGRIEHQIAWSDHGEIGRWVVKNPVVVLLDGTLFVHGGISPAYVDLTVAQINARAAAALTARSTDPTAINNDDQGPLWYRGLAQPPASNNGETLAARTPAQIQPAGEDQLDALLSAYGARRIVVGHTPILSGIAFFQDGKLICIDTGISAVYGGTVSYLDIVDGTPVPHAVARSQQPLKQGAP
ncbi:MAG: metallophosphoesterase [Steroidobacteraceae bacterium]